MDQKTLLNTHAGYLRDVADKDYVQARTMYYFKYGEHFLWSSLQALEKYLKAIHLFCRMSAKQYGHVTLPVVDNLQNKTPIDFQLTSEERKFLQRLDAVGADRYAQIPKYNLDTDLVVLDNVVWKIRRYCQHLEDPQGQPDQAKITSIAQYAMDQSYKYKVPGGQLEKVLRDTTKDKQVRARLTWQNFRFCNKRRKIIRNYRMFLSGVYPQHLKDQNHVNILKQFLRL